MGEHDTWESASNFLKGVVLLTIGSLIIYLGQSVRNDSCTFFGSSFFCSIGSWVLIVGAIALLPGLIFVGLSIYDLAESRRASWRSDRTG